MPYVHFLNMAAHMLRTEIVFLKSPWVFPYLAESGPRKWVVAGTPFAGYALAAALSAFGIQHERS
jgi:hypothetical protein